MSYQIKENRTISTLLFIKKILIQKRKFDLKLNTSDVFINCIHLAWMNRSTGKDKEAWVILNPTKLFSGEDKKGKKAINTKVDHDFEDFISSVDWNDTK